METLDIGKIAFLPTESRLALLKEFREQILEVTLIVRDALLAGDLKTAAKSAHMIRSSCLALGAEQLSAASLRIEASEKGDVKIPESQLLSEFVNAVDVILPQLDIELRSGENPPA
ncbi:MAG: Hpt domain-containing protein [Spirochaetia bacterium]|nr:Hpt domain-containing protein [Spirochaetia bacterium]